MRLLNVMSTSRALSTLRFCYLSGRNKRLSFSELCLHVAVFSLIRSPSVASHRLPMSDDCKSRLDYFNIYIVDECPTCTIQDMLCLKPCPFCGCLNYRYELGYVHMLDELEVIQGCWSWFQSEIHAQYLPWDLP